SGNLYFRTGGGVDTLTLLAAQTYNLNASFGAGNDTFVMNNAGLLLNGFLDFGTGDDVMTQTAGTFGNINIINL
ncbi:MAG: hypothetical protein K1X57_14100, partial [Gemmataceae bacterium]|nr:hypothetical protein [Gemmataceae bacterium]